MKHIKLFEEFLNEAKSLLFSFDYNTDEDDVDYIQGLLKDARVDAIAQPGLDSEEMIVKAKNEVELRKAKKAIQANGFQIYESVVKKGEWDNSDAEILEAIDTKYWADYNTDTSGKGNKEFANKSTDFEDTFSHAVSDWNEEADGAENRIKGSQVSKIKKLAQEFYKKEGWISVNVAQAMISQEGY
jgi:hypothetical protein